jgi:hypothetical protein
VIGHVPTIFVCAARDATNKRERRNSFIKSIPHARVVRQNIRIGYGH